MRRSTSAAALLAAVLSACALGQQANVPQFTVSTFAGTGAAGFSGDGGPATGSTLNGPNGLAFDSAGNLYIADETNNRVRKVTPDGTISTIAGSGTPGFTGDGGPAINASLNGPYRLLVDSAGDLFISDLFNNRIRKVTANGTITTVAGNGNAAYSGDGGPATSAAINGPADLAFDSAGNLFISSSGSNVVRKIAPNGIITTVAGNGTAGYSGDNAPATNAQLNSPKALVFDTTGNLLISDQGNSRIRKISNGLITTVAGGITGFLGDGGPAMSARLNAPGGMVFDAAGNLYIADIDNNRIRVLLPDGTINTVAGNGTANFSGDGGPATNAGLDSPRSLAIDSSGRIYVADYSENRIRLLTPAAGIIPIITEVISASAFGTFAAIAPGSWFEIHGSGLAADSRGWTPADFNGSTAPTSLDGTSVSIGGQAAFIEYISATQVNAQVPSGIPIGQQQVVVTSPAGTSAPYAVTVSPTAPGLLAPSSLLTGGMQYVAAQFASTMTPVFTPGDPTSSLSPRARPGDTIILYGIGFGPVTPDNPAGQIEQQSNTLVTSPQFSFGGMAATLMSAGLVQGSIGLYQFSIVVPAVAASDTIPLTFTLGSVTGSQALYIAVGN